MSQVLQKSLNTGAIFVSDLLGPDNLYEYLKLFGFGDSTNSGMGGEADGLVRTNKDPRLVRLRPRHQQLRPGHRRNAAAGDHGHVGGDQRWQAHAAIHH